MGTMPGTYHKRYGEYSQDELSTYEERFQNLIESYEKFKRYKAEKLGENCGFRLNLSITDRVILLYLNDLKEFKTFHNANTGTDHYKRAAYIARNIAQEKPIEFISGEDALVTINADFAMWVYLAYLRINPKLAGDSDERFYKVMKNIDYVFRRKDPQKELLAGLSIAMEAAFT